MARIGISFRWQGLGSYGQSSFREDIQRRSGAAATAADLVPGIRVTVAPLPADPGRADAVVIEDTGT